MTFLPIVERELRVRARLRSTYRFRLLAALGAIALVGLLLLMSHNLPAAGAYGWWVFDTLAWVSFVYCLLEGTRHTADCLSQEKREGTLGLLFLTDLRPYDVVLGKLMATSLNSIYGLLAIFPPLAIPLVIGGVTVGEFWRLVLVLLNTVFFSLTTGLMVSAASRDARRAWSSTTGLVLLLAVAPALLLLKPAWSSSPMTALSPATGFLGVFDRTYATTPDQYWRAIGSVHLLSWAFLVTATFVLPRAWQDRAAAASGSWWRRFISCVGASGQAFGRTQDLARRSRIFDGNPVVWLVVRSGTEQAFLWTLVSTSSVAALTAWLWARGSAPMALMIFGVMLLVHLTLAVWMASQACHLFASARDSGALELLVCTPLNVRDLVDGHILGLKQMVYRPLMLLLAVEGILLGAEVCIIGWRGTPVLVCVGIVVLAGLYLAIAVLDLVAVTRYGLWQGLANRRPTKAVTRTVLHVLLLPMVGGLTCTFGAGWPLIGLVKNLIFINYAQEQLRRYFRSLLTERYGWSEEPEYVGQPTERALAHQLPRVLPR